jgi:hypothetical protein
MYLGSGTFCPNATCVKESVRNAKIKNCFIKRGLSSDVHPRKAKIRNIYLKSEQ